VAPPKGESGARTDTARGRAFEAAFQVRKANDIAAAAQAQRAQALQESFNRGQLLTGQPDFGGSSPAVVVQSAGDKAQEDYYNNLREEQKTSARGFLNTLLTQYNMQSLAGQIEGFIQQSTNNDFLAEKIRETAEYKTRFKGLVDLRARGVTDVQDEGQYLRLESQYRQVFREAGLVNYLGVSGSQGEYNSIADLVGKFSLSVNEVQDRVQDAQRVVRDTPQEVRDSLQRFYNVDPATLVEYALDPTRTQNKINQLANTAIVGGYASRAGLNLDVAGAESIAGLSGSSDINVERFTVDAAAGRAVRDSTKRLAEIEKSTLSDTESLTASMGVDTEAKKKVTTLQSRERARFGGTSGIGSTTLSNARTI